MVLLFALGAGLGSVATLRWGEKTIWLSSALLTVSFLVMFLREEEARLHRE